MVDCRNRSAMLVFSTGTLGFGPVRCAWCSEVCMNWKWLIFCLFFVTGLLLYFPIVYIRKTNQILEVLQRIERNTRDLQGAPSIARDITRAVSAE